MSYNITLTNGSLFAVIPDGTINTDSSMTLIGRNYAGGYGEFQDDNFIRLLESGADTTAPATPLIGQLWYNTTSSTLQVYNGTNFKPISGATASSTAPTVNATGDLWFDTVEQQLNVYTGTAWLVVGPQSSSGSGAIAATLLDAGNVAYSVVELTVDGNIVGIVSQASRFAPFPALSGFGNVYPGITLSTSVNGQTPSLVGTATNAITLAGLANTAFMRTDQSTSTIGRLFVYNDLGIAVGNSSQLTANVVSNSTVNLYNNALDGDFNIGVNQGGTKTAAIQIDGATSDVIIAGNLVVAGNTITVNNEIINTDQLITGNLSVVGNIRSASTISVAGNIRTSGNISVTGAVVANVMSANILIGAGGNISNITGANVTGTVANATYATNAANAVYANTAGNATIFATAAWTVQEIGGKLYFQTGNANIASLDSSGNFTTIGNVTAFGTP